MSTPCAVIAGPLRERLQRAAPPLAATVCAVVVAACNIDNPGVTPPDRELNFPLAMTLGPAEGDAGAPRWLYVVNSNFNVRFNSGTLQSVDLQVVDEAAKQSQCFDDMTQEACNRVGGEFREAEEECCVRCLDAPVEVLCDGRDDPALQACCRDSLFEDGFTFVPKTGEVRVASFVSGMAASADGQRLYMSVRGNDSLLFVDVDGGKLDCGQGEDDLCPDEAYVGDGAPLPDTEAEFAPLPLDVIAGAPEDFGLSGGRDVVLVAHDDGSVSLFADGDGEPDLRATLQNFELLQRPVTMRRNPHDGLVYITNESSTEIARVGLERIGGRTVPFYTSPLRLTGLRNNDHSRDLAFDPRDPARLYGLVQGIPTQNTAIVRSVLFLERTPDRVREVRTVDAMRVGLGPARIQQADVGGSSYLFVSCFDDRSLFIIEADTRQLVGFVRGLFGPFDFEVDPARERAYVADFASSTIRVVDLRGLGDRNLPPPRVVLTLGQPRIAGGVF